ncbi:MAG: SemiSWEET transporter [Spirochaetes bacterium]|nr:SemiSWEET transporter [Spirochaetota bacterium]
MNYIDLLGFAAALGTTSSLVPQAYKIFKTQKTGDLSLFMYGLICGGVFLWFVYGLLICSYPVIFSNGLTFVLSVYIMIMKIRHG